MELTTIFQNAINFLMGPISIFFMLVAFILITYSLFAWYGADDRKQVMQRYTNWIIGVLLFLCAPRIAGTFLAPEKLAAYDEQVAKEAAEKAEKAAAEEKAAKDELLANKDSAEYSAYLYSEYAEAQVEWNNAKDAYIDAASSELWPYMSAEEQGELIDNYINAENKQKSASAAYNVQESLNSSGSGQAHAISESAWKEYSDLTDTQKTATFEQLSATAQAKIIELEEAEKKKKELEEKKRLEEQEEKMKAGGTGGTKS